MPGETEQTQPPQLEMQPLAISNYSQAARQLSSRVI